MHGFKSVSLSSTTERQCTYNVTVDRLRKHSFRGKATAFFLYCRDTYVVIDSKRNERVCCKSADKDT